MLKVLKFLVILYTVALFSAMTVFRPVNAIVVVVPVIVGLPIILGWALGLASLPVTLVSVFVNVDRFKTSKKKFFIFTLLTWFGMLTIVGLITTIVYYLR